VTVPSTPSQEKKPDVAGSNGADAETTTSPVPSMVEHEPLQLAVGVVPAGTLAANLAAILYRLLGGG